MTILSCGRAAEGKTKRKVIPRAVASRQPGGEWFKKVQEVGIPIKWLWAEDFDTGLA